MLQNFLYIFFSWVARDHQDFKFSIILKINLVKNPEKIVVWLFSKRRSTHDEEKRQRKNSREKKKNSRRKSPSNSIATVEHNVVTPISYP